VTDNLPEEDQKRYRRYLRAEQEAVALYASLLETESHPRRAEIFRELMESEQRHVWHWAEKLGMTSSEVASSRFTFRVRALGFVARILGAVRILPVVLMIEGDDTVMYRGDPEASQVMLEGEEHAKKLRGMKEGKYSIGDFKESSWQGSTASGAFRAGVLGVNDGLVSNFGLVWGVAGGVVSAKADSEIVLLAGLAGLTAGAFSMAAGEYVSMRAGRDLAEYRIEMEREELRELPEEERQELTLIYELKGLTPSEAENLADRVMQDKDVALDVMVREELGLNPRQLGSPWSSALSSFLAFACGAIVPVSPYIFLAGSQAFAVSGILSAFALFCVGGVLAFLSAKNAAWGGVRMLLIGVFAALITYSVGSVVGVTLG